ncbi:MAG: hypothetical protein V1773_16570 [bacterium]
MNFSERNGLVPVRTQLQVGSMDDKLKISLWNYISKFIASIDYGKDEFREDIFYKQELMTKIWCESLYLKLDEIPENSYGWIDGPLFMNKMDGIFFKLRWNLVYDLIEFLFLFLAENVTDEEFVESKKNELNIILNKECAGYRLINGQIVQITTEEEIVEIEEALKNTNKYESVHTHIQTALKLLSDRQSPDYRNSVKESISAVEAVCIIITNDPKATLGQALKIIETKYNLHGALKEAFTKLYGYTSDGAGIRHALLEDSVALTSEDAKFMLVTCSAFTNYLIAKTNIIESL